jgi:alanine dehydrogenase
VICIEAPFAVRFALRAVTNVADREARERAAIFITEDDVRSLLSLDRAIDVLGQTYERQAADGVIPMRRAHARSGQLILHAVGGAIAADGIAGVKTWLYTPRGAQPVLVLFGLGDGRVVAVIEAFLLGQLRTAATSGLATRLLSRTGAGSLALLGTGKQAAAQAAAVCAVRDIERISLYGRDAERRGRLARELREAHGVPVDEADSVARAVDGASVVTVVTRAQQPIVSADVLLPGMHVNAVGAITPDRSELDVAAVAAFDVLVADSVEQARADAGDLRAAVDAGAIGWRQVHGLDQIAAGARAGRQGGDDLTLFRALGVGTSDVALGSEVLRLAREHDRGSALRSGRAAQSVVPALQGGDVYG